MPTSNYALLYQEAFFKSDDASTRRFWWIHTRKLRHYSVRQKHIRKLRKLLRMKVILSFVYVNPTVGLFVQLPHVSSVRTQNLL